MMFLTVVFSTILTLICMVLFVTIWKLKQHKNGKRKKTASILIVVGSGGHTKEMLTLISSLGSHYSLRHYIIANTDNMSEEKVCYEEGNRKDLSKDNIKYEIHHIPRSREVMQSWFSTVLSTVFAILYSFPLVFKINPDIILCNGPGTCIPICLVGFLLKVLTFGKVCIIFVESICRVETLSLSGRILYYLADYMLVQWPELKQKYPRTKYIGRIV